MADGNTISGGGSGGAYKWSCYVNLYEIARTDTTLTLRCDVGYYTRWAIDCHANGWNSVGGSWNGSVYSGSNSDWRTVNVITTDFVVARGASAYTYTVSGGVQVTGGFGNGTSTAEASVTVPQRAYYKPRPPKDFALTSSGDQSQSLTWTADYTGMDGGYPWHSVELARSVDESDRETIASMGWDTTNRTDNTTEAGRRYDYWVRSTGPGGVSDWVGPLTVYTTPLAPKSLSAAKSAAATVSLTVVGPPKYVDSYDFGRTADRGATWAAIEVDDMKDAAAPAGTVRYRCRAVKSGKASAWVTSNDVTTICPPLAPTLGKLAACYPTGAPVSVAWTCNHPDGSPQRAAQAEFSTPAGPMLVEVSGAGGTASVASPGAGQWDVRVRTKGVHDDWGEWSSRASFNVADPPQAWISSPSNNGDYVDALPLVVSWEASDSSGVARQLLELLDSSGSAIARAEPSATARSWRLGADAGFDNGKAYALRLTVWSGSTLSVVAERRFSTRWAQPDPARVAVEFDESCAATVTVKDAAEPYAFDGGSLSGFMEMTGLGVSLQRRSWVDAESHAVIIDDDAVQAVEFDVVRVNPDGSLTQLAESIPGGRKVFDPLPPIGVEFPYRVRSVAESGASTTRDTAAKCWNGSAMLNFGQAAETAVHVRCSPALTGSGSRSVKLIHFAGGGDDVDAMLPVAYELDEYDATKTFEFDVRGSAEMERLRMITSESPQGWARDPFGGRIHGYIELDGKWKAEDVIAVTAKVSRTRWREPVNG